MQKQHGQPPNINNASTTPRTDYQPTRIEQLMSTFQSRLYHQQHQASNTEKTSDQPSQPHPSFDVEATKALDDEEWKPSRHELVIFFCLALVSFMVAVDANIIATALDTIAVAVNATADQSFWVGTSYLLVCAVTIPFIGALSDIFGRPPWLLFCLLLFTIGSIVCGSAKSIETLLVGRCIQGLGGGGITILAAVIVTDIVPLRYRPKWYGIVQGSWALGSTLGPLLGGAFSEKASWRWVFWFMLPFCGVSFAIIPMVLTLKPKTETLRTKLARVDWMGGFLFIGSCTSFLIAISWGGTQFSWDSASTLCPLLIGVAGLGGCLVWEAYYATEPFLRPSLFRDISSCVAYFSAILQGLTLYGGIYYGPVYLLGCLLSSPLQTGVRMLPVTLTCAPIAVITGAIVTRINKYRWAVLLGWAILSLGEGLFQILTQKTPLVAWVFFVLIIGIGHGLLLPSLNFATQALSDPVDHGAAATMYMFMRHLGTALGVGLGGSVFTNTMKRALRSRGLDTNIAINAEGFIPTLAKMSDSDPQKTLLLESYVAGFHGVFYLYLGLSLFALVITFFMQQKKMHNDLQTDHKLEEVKNHRLSGLLNSTKRSSGLTSHYRDSLGVKTTTGSFIGDENNENND